MNEKFFTLPKERQLQMINAGYQIFATYPYKKAPTSAVADAAGISKPLLFHYFGNKKGFYLYLFKLALNTSNEQRDEECLDGETDFFQYMLKIIRKELRLMGRYPYMTKFMRSAYFEADPDVRTEIDALKKGHIGSSQEDMLKTIDRSRFKDSNAPELLLEIITLSIEGYMTFNSQTAFQHPESVMKEFERVIFSLRDHYYK